jgi:hypothetical protein
LLLLLLRLLLLRLLLLRLRRLRSLCLLLKLQLVVALLHQPPLLHQPAPFEPRFHVPGGGVKG